MQEPLVITVLVHYNHLEDTLACLDTLLAQTYPNQQILFVDNKSLDQGYRIVADQYPEIEQLRIEPRNLGFTGGYNRGMQHALQSGADLVFIISNDTLLAPDALAWLVRACQEESIGAAAPLIFYHAAPDQVWFAGNAINPITLDTIKEDANLVPRDAYLPRDFLSGCALIFPRTALEQVGLFDEGFFMYYEDLDLSYRFLKAGYTKLLVPQAHIWHKVSLSSGGADSPNERYMMGRNSLRYFRKHLPGLRWLVVIPWRLGSVLRTSIRLLGKDNLAALNAYWRGLRDGLFYPERPPAP